MSVIAANNPAIRLPIVPDTKPAAGTDEKAEAPAPAAETKAVEGVAVKISSAGFQAAKADSNKDIDDSNLKDSIKQLLKMIRELKKQIADKMAEIAAASADNSLTPEARQARVGNLQASLAALQSGLTMAQMQLGKALKDEPADAQMQAMSLASK
jgi:hypothetical protein